MGLDGLSSAAYGPEAALILLVPLGAAAPSLLAPIMLVILALLGILYLSYRQVINAYPVNGGSYTVAKENLGTRAGLLAATALMIDYVLNVAVGISAGVGALVSAIPALQPLTVWLCLAVLGALTLLNLRGTRKSGSRSSCRPMSSSAASSPRSPRDWSRWRWPAAIPRRSRRRRHCRRRARRSGSGSCYARLPAAARR